MIYLSVPWCWQSSFAKPVNGTQALNFWHVLEMCQVIGPELTLYDSIHRPSDSLVLPERDLRAKMNVFARYWLSTTLSLRAFRGKNVLYIDYKSAQIPAVLLCGLLRKSFCDLLWPLLVTPILFWFPTCSGSNHLWICTFSKVASYQGEALIYVTNDKLPSLLLATSSHAWYGLYIDIYWAQVGFCNNCNFPIVSWTLTYSKSFCLFTQTLNEGSWYGPHSEIERFYGGVNEWG